MIATINITTAAGKSFEGFPKDADTTKGGWVEMNLSNDEFYIEQMFDLGKFTLHVGDKITIEIKETT